MNEKTLTAPCETTCTVVYWHGRLLYDQGYDKVRVIDCVWSSHCSCHFNAMLKLDLMSVAIKCQQYSNQYA